VEELAFWSVVIVLAAIALVILGVAFFERRHRRRIEALGKRRKDRIQL
jgi:putative exporter of polyketide antibiotics